MKALMKDGGRIGVLRHPRLLLEEPTQIRVGIALAALTPFDLQVAQGQVSTPDRLVLGHQASGTILEVGEEVQDYQPGQRVSLFPWKGCGFCSLCSESKPFLCAQGEKLGLHRNGVFAEEVVVDQAMVEALPEPVSLAQGCLLEPLTRALAVLDCGLQTHWRGCLLEQSLEDRLLGRVLGAAGFRKLEKYEQAREFGDRQFDFVIESQASPEEASQLLRLLRPGGLWVLQGEASPPLNFDLRSLARKGVRLLPVHHGSPAVARERLADPDLNLDDLLGPTSGLEDWPMLFAEAERPSGKRQLLKVADL